MSLDEIHHEVDFMRRVHHENIVAFRDAIEDKDTLCLVSELCTGGELLDKLLTKGNYSEAVACSVMRQLVSAVMYLHSIGIVHRDIKPDNILMASPESDLIKISDFGLSGELTTPDGKKIALSEKCGTPEYCSPEVTQQQPYDGKCDWWSVGVCLFILLIGKFPFHGATMEKDICAGKLVFPGRSESTLSKPAVDLIRKLLVVDPAKRYRGEDILAHPWMRGGAKTTSVSADTIDRLRGFVARRRFLKGINAVRGVYRFTSLLVRLRLLNAYRAASPPPLLPVARPVCVLTGATGGLGRETARAMAKLGYHVIAGCRNEQRGSELLTWLRSSVPGCHVETRSLDLCSCESIFRFVADLRKRNLPVNSLVHAAGVLFPDTKVTHDGVGTTMMVNLYGPFLLTQLLQDVLKRSGGGGGGPRGPSAPSSSSSGTSRVVMVTSSGHKYADGTSWVDYEAVALTREEGLGLYAKSKLGVILYAQETARRLRGKGVSVNTFNPGGVNTPIGSELSGRFCAGLTLRSPAAAAKHLAFLASSPTLEGVTGEYFCDRATRKPGSNTTDRADAQKLWNVAAKITTVYAYADKLAFGVSRWISADGKPLRLKHDGFHHSNHAQAHSSEGSVTEGNSDTEDSAEVASRAESETAELYETTSSSSDYS
jgi:NAD(P)-dependent dehydrogenase (short-subunit alcohol dehydrogenase family)